jgi:3,4-dehydroadipyl-CoA semialdehyde dehydrogenase
VLPPGVLSLLTGSVGDLLDHLGPQDVVAFTGSADTGARIRGHQRVLSAGVPVNVEADSLNSTVLAPGAEDATYDALIRHVHTEMTQKAGQKCTATRRILVPRDRLDEVIADISERLRGVVVGDPVTGRREHGAAVDGRAAPQRRGGHRNPDRRRRAGGLRGPGRGEPRGVAEGKGYFVSPLLLVADEPLHGAAVHDLEVFGPVSTLLPYDGSVSAAEAIVARGQGSLVCSIYGDDRPWLERPCSPSARTTAASPWWTRRWRTRPSARAWSCRA